MVAVIAAIGGESRRTVAPARQVLRARQVQRRPAAAPAARAGQRPLAGTAGRARRDRSWCAWAWDPWPMIWRPNCWCASCATRKSMPANVDRGFEARCRRPEAADAVSIVYVVSAFPSEERSRGEATAEEMRRRFPHACIVAVLLPGMLLQPEGRGRQHTRSRQSGGFAGPRRANLPRLAPRRRQIKTSRG